MLKIFVLFLIVSICHPATAKNNTKKSVQVGFPIPTQFPLLNWTLGSSTVPPEFTKPIKDDVLTNEDLQKRIIITHRCLLYWHRKRCNKYCRKYGYGKCARGKCYCFY